MYQRQVTFSEAISRAITNYCRFTGRASRSEFWWWQLFTFIVAAAFGVCQGIFLGLFGYESVLGKCFSYLEWVWCIAIFLPSLGLVFRRLHDIGKSGWNILWSLLPLVGAIILLVFYCRDSEMADNQYGPVPNYVS